VCLGQSVVVPRQTGLEGCTLREMGFVGSTHAMKHSRAALDYLAALPVAPRHGQRQFETHEREFSLTVVLQCLGQALVCQIIIRQSGQGSREPFGGLMVFPSP